MFLKNASFDEFLRQEQAGIRDRSGRGNGDMEFTSSFTLCADIEVHLDFDSRETCVAC